MVKRPLTRIAYLLGLRARSPHPQNNRARPCPSPPRSSGPFGHIATASQHHAPHGSGGQGPAAREIVEGFFFRRLRTEDGKRVGRLLVKSPPGLGKTREAIEWAIAYQTEQAGKDGTRLPVGDFNEADVTAQTSIFVPRHQLAAELGQVIEEAFRERGAPITANGFFKTISRAAASIGLGDVHPPSVRLQARQ